MFLGIGLRLGMLGSVFSPANLFASSEQGAWYDPSDLSTLFQDSLGTTPVTTAGQPVGLMLDKSQGLVLGLEVFSSASVSSSAGVVQDGTSNNWVMTAAAPNNSAIVYNAGFTARAGKGFVVSVEVYDYASGSINMRLQGINGPNISSNGTYEYQHNAIATGDFIGIAISATATLKVRNVSIRELAGNHATQATSAKRPTYQYVWDGVGPLGPEKVTNGDFPVNVDGWTANGAGGATNVTFSAVGGRMEIVRGAGSIDGLPFQSMATIVGQKYIFTFTGTGNLVIRLGSSGVSSSEYFQDITVNETQTVTFVATTTTATISMWGPNSSTATADNISIKEIPVGSRLHYLAFDGVDDAMVTGTITPGVDKAQVFAGVRKVGNTVGILAETSATLDSNSGSFAIVAPNDVTVKYRAASKGTIAAFADATSATYNSPVTTVLTALADISNDSAILRLDGSQIGSSVANQGTGNFLAYPLYLGARNQASLYFNGNLYGLITRFGPNLTDAQIASTEAYVAAKTGVTL